MSQLVGAVVKTLRIEPYHASSIAEAIQLGEYDDHDEDNHIIQLFYESEVSPADQLNNKLKELLDRDCEPGYENKTIQQKLWLRTKHSLYCRQRFGHRYVCHCLDNHY